MDSRELEPSPTQVHEGGSGLPFIQELADGFKYPLELLEDVIEQSGSAVWIADGEGTMLRMNQPCRDLLCMRDEEILGRYNLFRDRALESAGLLPSVRRVFDAGVAVRFTVECDTAKLVGVTPEHPVKLYLETTIYPVKDESGRVTNAVVRYIDATAARTAEEALRHSEARLLQAQAVAGVGSWELDLATGSMWGSEEAFRIYGAERTSPSVDLERVQAFVLPEDRPRLDEALEHLVRGGAPYDLEFHIRRPSDGALRTVHSIAEVVRDADGAPSSVVGVIQDITEQRLVQERLRITEYSVDHALDAVFWVDSSARFTWVSDATCRVFGYSREELLSMMFFDIDRLITAEVWEAGWSRLKEQGGYTFETVLVRKNGTSFPAELNVSYVEYGGEEGSCAFTRDISDRKRYEDNATWLSRILDESLNEVYVFDAETLRFVLVNRGAQRNLGYSMEELAAMTPLDITPALDRTTLEELVAPLRAQREPQVVFETVHRRKDGSLYPVEVHLQLTQREYRPMFLAIILDITARREAEEALGASEEKLRQSQKMEAIGLLAGGIAHDFNNLLTAIIGYTDLLLESACGEQERLRSDLEEIRSAAGQASALTSQILAFSRRQTLRPRVVSLNDVLTGVEPLLRRTLGEDIDLVTVKDPGLGSVEVDTHQFEQVLMNLAVNARDAMPGGGRLTLETANVTFDPSSAPAHPDLSAGSYVVLAASDTGHGMDEETMARIFDPFFTTKPIGQGTGLGLSMVYGIVRQSGGVVTVSSRPGEGSCFTIFLPRVSAAPEVPDAALSARPSVSQGGETVLVVEDEASLGRLVARVLGGIGYRVLVAGSGAEALDIFARLESPPDLLLTDLILPGGMQGHELAARLRPSLRGAPILYMSGYAPHARVPDAGVDQVARFLQKPFSPEELAEAVREALDARAAG